MEIDNKQKPEIFLSLTLTKDQIKQYEEKQAEYKERYEEKKENEKVELIKTNKRASYKNLYLVASKDYENLEEKFKSLNKEYEDLKNKYDLLLQDLDYRIFTHSAKCKENHKANPESLRKAQMRYYYKKKLQEGKKTRKDPFESGILKKTEY